MSANNRLIKEWKISPFDWSLFCELNEKSRDVFSACKKLLFFWKHSFTYVSSISYKNINKKKIHQNICERNSVKKKDHFYTILKGKIFPFKNKRIVVCVWVSVVFCVICKTFPTK